MSSNKIWTQFPGCECLKSILSSFGYDNPYSLKCLNTNTTLIELEEQVQKNNSIIGRFTCEHAERYKLSTKFEFLAGHRALLLNWCQNLNNPVSKQDDIDAFINKNPAFSTILKEIIKSALANHGKPPNTKRFSQTLMDFSVYIFIMAGRACYNVLSANLPIPKTGTICKFSLSTSKSVGWGKGAGAEQFQIALE